MKLFIAFLLAAGFFAAPKLDVKTTKLKNCQVEETKKEEYEELFLPDGEVVIVTTEEGEE